MLQERDILVRTLCTVYRMMVASVPLLEFAIPRSTGAVRRYYAQHLIEEDGHDEMLLDDLNRLGVEDIPRSHIAAQIAGSQYYLIAHEHPALLLGYMHALERESLSVDAVDALSAHHGTPLTCLRHHSLHDPAHKLDLETVIASHSEWMQQRIRWNEDNVIRLLNEALK